MSVGFDWAGVVVAAAHFSYAISSATERTPATASPISSTCEVVPGHASIATRFSLVNEWKTQR
jgi:hypothetical protein